MGYELFPGLNQTRFCYFLTLFDCVNIEAIILVEICDGIFFIKVYPPPPPFKLVLVDCKRI